MDTWQCPCGSETTGIQHTRSERPTCRWCGHLMFTSAEAATIAHDEWQRLERERDVDRQRLVREVRALVDEAHRDPYDLAASLYVRLDGIERRVIDPLAGLEAAIAAMTADELELLEQRLEAIGLRMVERAAALRVRLKD